MATKKAIKAPPEDVPAVLFTEAANKTVARAKASLAKKWSLVRAESVFDCSDLTWLLLAARRDDEARDLAVHVVERVRFADDKNAWLASSLVIAFAARLARLDGDDARRSSLGQRLAEHPAVPSLLQAVADAHKDIRSAEVEPSPKWALQHFARGCARATYLQEAVAAGAYEAGVLDEGAIARVVSDGLDGLRAHLAR